MFESKEGLKYDDYPYLVYARVSTDSDEQKDSLANQVDICRYWLEQHDFEWDDRAILQDAGKSGTMFLERSAMQLVLKKARNREIKMVVFKSLHRLARDLKDALEIKEVMLGHGVRVITIEEGYDSELEGKNDMKFEMFSMFAAQYPKTQSVSISAALAAKVRRGDHIGKTPYGYEKIDQKLLIKEGEAAIIHQIFKWYNEEKIGMKSITNKLNKGVAEGTILPPRNGGAWQLTTIQRIIRNRTFCGDFILNQYTKIKVDGRKKQIRNPESKWIVFKDHHPAIVSREAFDLANDKKVLNKKKKISPYNEFRGLLKCAHCGCSMIINQAGKRKKDGTHWRYLKCSNYRRSGQCVSHVPMTYENLRITILKDLISESEKVNFHLEKSLNDNKNQKMKKLNNTIAATEQKKNRLLDLYLDEMINKYEYEAKRERLEHEINRMNDELFLLNSEEENEVNITHIKQAIRALNDTEKDLFHVFQALIDFGVVYQNGQIDLKYTFQANEEEEKA
ncbi:recombinase family protein [Paraliobacillus sp. X-1268]|uniref:recombinase family protein n=1 Tax=Paraliobacillus sp. X-1268 TaxID=2213193 RepID=UPI000E3D1C62|nr:recombinase family protein [Paraliobacillus sp. X-1268]